MIISRTPLRISFFGGGTDYPAWYQEHGGAVIGAAIDKYCWVSVRILPPFFDHKYRIVYSKTEEIADVSEIEHPAVRACIQNSGLTDGLEIHCDADLPSRTGLGSSSAFTVGLINALVKLGGGVMDNSLLAMRALFIERGVLKETVGTQDQILCAMGGIRKIIFGTNTFSEDTILSLYGSRAEDLRNHLMLVFTGVSRFASDIARSQVSRVKENAKALDEMRAQVDEAAKILLSTRPVTDLACLLNHAWELKRSLSQSVSNSYIDAIMDKAKKAGALGGKLLGAGGGGFILLLAEPEKHEHIRKNLPGLVHVPFDFDNRGSKIVCYP